MEALLKLGERDLGDYHLTKLPDYNSFWCSMYLLGVVVVLMCVVCFRSLILGYPSSRLYPYALIFLCVYCVLTVWSHISSSKKNSDELMLMFFYFVFAVVFSLCLMNLRPSVIGVDLLAMLSTLRSRFQSLVSFVGLGGKGLFSRLHMNLHIPTSVIGFVVALLLGLLPPLLVESAFRFAQLELRKGLSVNGVLSSHLLCGVCVMSIPGVLRLVEGKMIGGIL